MDREISGGDDYPRSSWVQDCTKLLISPSFINSSDSQKRRLEKNIFSSALASKTSYTWTYDTMEMRYTAVSAVVAAYSIATLRIFVYQEDFINEPNVDLN